MARPFADGPLTVTPALTYPYPTGSYNPVGDTTGTIPATPGSGKQYTPPAYLQEEAADLGSPSTKVLPVMLHHIPGNPDPQAAFEITGATDMGALFTQGQLNHWQDLINAINLGFLTVSVAGTVPSTQAL